MLNLAFLPRKIHLNQVQGESFQGDSICSSESVTGCDKLVSGKMCHGLLVTWGDKDPPPLNRVQPTFQLQACLHLGHRLPLTCRGCCVRPVHSRLLEEVSCSLN